MAGPQLPMDLRSNICCAGLFRLRWLAVASSAGSCAVAPPTFGADRTKPVKADDEQAIRIMDQSQGQYNRGRLRGVR